MESNNTNNSNIVAAQSASQSSAAWDNISEVSSWKQKRMDTRDLVRERCWRGSHAAACSQGPVHE